MRVLFVIVIKDRFRIIHWEINYRKTIGINRMLSRKFPIILSDPINLSGGYFIPINLSEIVGVETAI